MSGEPGLAQSTLGEDEHLIKGPVTMWGLRPSNPKAAWGTIKLLLQRANKLSSDSLSGNKQTNREPKKVFLILLEAGYLLCLLLPPPLWP